MPARPALALSLRGYLTAATFSSLLFGLAFCSPSRSTGASPLPEMPEGLETALFAGGCFWCMEGPFEKTPGVMAVISGFAGGPEKNPTYRQVSSGRTGHTEAVRVYYDPTQVTYEQLLDVYWRQIDPTDKGGQFADRGSQYRPSIFYGDAQEKKIAEASKSRIAASRRFSKPIVVPIVPAGPFYAAEDYHQDYYRKNPAHYQSYRRGSGRAGYLRRVWGADHKEETKMPKAGWNIEDFKRPSDTMLAEQLEPMQFRVARKGGTEPPFQNAYWDNKEDGLYVDLISGEPLFSSRDKFKSGSGWPSFTRALVGSHVVEKRDVSHGMIRTEVRSRHGDSHLGHLFDDGPAPSGQRYCINSASLRFIPRHRMEAEGYGQYLDQVAEK